VENLWSRRANLVDNPTAEFFIVRDRPYSLAIAAVDAPSRPASLDPAGQRRRINPLVSLAEENPL
jgi:hypothetical protein